MKKIFPFFLALVLTCSACSNSDPFPSSFSITDSCFLSSDTSENTDEKNSVSFSENEASDEPDTIILESELYPGFYEVTVTAHTNFVLKNGGFKPKVTFILPNNVVFSDSGDNLTATFTDGTSLVVGWTFLYEKRDYDEHDNPLYYYENPEKSIGYISHSNLLCGNYECTRIIACGGHPKDDSSENDSERYYLYQYFICINDFEIFDIQFWAKGFDNEDSMKLQESIVESIKR